jgi:hypothetical protein
MALVRQPQYDVRGNSEEGTRSSDGYVDTSTGEIFRGQRVGDNENGYEYVTVPTGQTWDKINKADPSGRNIYGSEGYAPQQYESAGDESGESLSTTGVGGMTPSGDMQIAESMNRKGYTDVLAKYGITPKYDPKYGYVLPSNVHNAITQEYFKNAGLGQYQEKGIVFQMLDAGVPLNLMMAAVTGGALGGASLGAMIGADLGLTGAAATTVGNAVVSGVQNLAATGDLNSAIVAAVASGAGGLTGQEAAALLPAGTDPTLVKAISGAASGGVGTAIRGGDIGEGALVGGAAPIINAAFTGADVKPGTPTTDPYPRGEISITGMEPTITPAPDQGGVPTPPSVDTPIITDINAPITDAEVVAQIQPTGNTADINANVYAGTSTGTMTDAPDVEKTYKGLNLKADERVTDVKTTYVDDMGRPVSKNDPNAIREDSVFIVKENPNDPNKPYAYEARYINGDFSKPDSYETGGVGEYEGGKIPTLSASSKTKPTFEVITQDTPIGGFSGENTPDTGNVSISSIDAANAFIATTPTRNTPTGPITDEEVLGQIQPSGGNATISTDNASNVNVTTGANGNTLIDTTGLVPGGGNVSITGSSGGVSTAGNATVIGGGDGSNAASNAVITTSGSGSGNATITGDGSGNNANATIIGSGSGGSGSGSGSGGGGGNATVIGGGDGGDGNAAILKLTGLISDTDTDTPKKLDDDVQVDPFVDIDPPPEKKSDYTKEISILLNALLGDTGNTGVGPRTYDLDGSSGPGSAALAQALRVDAGAPIFGGEKKGKRRNVWNIESLRNIDETGA